MSNKFKPIVFITFISLLLTVLPCTKTDADQQSSSTNHQPALLERAKKINIDHKLTSLPANCLVFEVAEEKFEGKPMVVVREKHGGQCGGDPNTSPRLYSIAIDNKTGEIWSDANSLVGQMEKIREQ